MSTGGLEQAAWSPCIPIENEIDLIPKWKATSLTVSNSHAPLCVQEDFWNLCPRNGLCKIIHADLASWHYRTEEEEEGEEIEEIEEERSVIDNIDPVAIQVT